MAFEVYEYDRAVSLTERFGLAKLLASIFDVRSSVARGAVLLILGAG